ncbi:hypothetical protein B4079_1202 [Bacillus cereus]|nr:hypothetical protein B4079_1202 [Bacillus cereus]
MGIVLVFLMCLYMLLLGVSKKGSLFIWFIRGNNIKKVEY